MKLTSPRFVIFGAILGVLYYTVFRKRQWILLLAASLWFYAASGMEYLSFLLLTVCTTYFFARAMGGNLARKELPREESRKKNRRLLKLYLTVNFGMLFLCKACILKPVSGAVAGSPVSFLSLGLPLGISFYIFQSAGYVMDVYRGRIPAEENIFRLALFASYFPQLIQGPISRYSGLAPQLAARHDFDGKQVSFGLQRMLWGYFKKLVIADRLAPAVAVLREMEGNGAAFALLTVCYAVQIYGDFTGGIDIVLGLSQSLRITLPENFHHPFLAKNTAQYWRCWHITLGEWMRDYIFYPLSISKPLLRLGRAARRKWGDFGKRLPVYAASAVTWFATGIWHGLTPNFVLWGMLNWSVIVISGELKPLYEKFHNQFALKEKRWYGAFEVLRMFCLMNLIRACDLYPNVGVYFRNIAALFSGFQTVQIPGMTALDWWIIALGIAIMAAVSLIQEKKGSLRELLWERPALRQGLLFALFLAVLLLGHYGVGHNAASFIYNQF